MRVFTQHRSLYTTRAGNARPNPHFASRNDPRIHVSEPAPPPENRTHLTAVEEHDGAQRVHGCISPALVEETARPVEVFEVLLVCLRCNKMINLARVFALLHARPASGL